MNHLEECHHTQWQDPLGYQVQQYQQSHHWDQLDHVLSDLGHHINIIPFKAHFHLMRFDHLENHQFYHYHFTDQDFINSNSIAPILNHLVPLIDPIANSLSEYRLELHFLLQKCLKHLDYFHYCKFHMLAHLRNHLILSHLPPVHHILLLISKYLK